MSNNGKRIIGPDSRILSLEDAREEATAAAARRDPELLGEAGRKRNATKEFVLETATYIALGACERTYQAMSEQSAGQMATLEAAVRAEMRAEIERTTIIGNVRRALRSADRYYRRACEAIGVTDPDEAAS